MLRASLLCLLLCPLLLLSACAAMEEQAREQVCNREAGYERGINDAQEGNQMDSNFASICDPTTRKEVKQAYREGYEAEQNRTSIDVTNGGVRIKMPGININTDKKAWSCELNLFGKTYRGYGSSRGQASSDTQRLCEAEQNAVHCSHGIRCKSER